MAKKKQTLEQIETSLARWRTRVKRAMTMIDKLERARKRLTKAEAIAEPVLRKIAGMPKTPEGAVLVSARPARGSSDEPAAEKPKPVSAPVPPAPVALVERLAKQVAEQVPQQVHQSDMLGDDIPAFLRRQTAPSPVAEAIRQEQAETKRLKAKGRIAKMKAKKAGDLKKMPLTGKAALAAIRG